MNPDRIFDREWLTRDEREVMARLWDDAPTSRLVREVINNAKIQVLHTTWCKVGLACIDETCTEKGNVRDLLWHDRLHEALRVVERFVNGDATGTEVFTAYLGVKEVIDEAVRNRSINHTQHWAALAVLVIASAKCDEWIPTTVAACHSGEADRLQADIIRRFIPNPFKD